MPYDKGDFTQQGINGEVSALVRLNEKRVMKVVLSSDDESDNCDISGKVYDLLNGTSYDLGGTTPTGTITITDTSLTDVAEYRYAQVSDENLVAGNIKNGVEILGVTGTFEGSAMVTQLHTILNAFSANPAATIDISDYIGELIPIDGHFTAQIMIDGVLNSYNFTYDDNSYMFVDNSNTLGISFDNRELYISGTLPSSISFRIVQVAITGYPINVYMPAGSIFQVGALQDPSETNYIYQLSNDSDDPTTTSICLPATLYGPEGNK